MMFFKMEKLNSRIEEIHPFIYYDRRPIEGWLVKEDKTKLIKYPPALDDSWQPIQPGDEWAGRDAYYWFQTSFKVPIFCKEDTFAMIFDFGKTELANLGGFESLLFINGSPYQGVDTFHKETFLDNADYSGKTIQIAFKAWSGLEGGGPCKTQHHKFAYADYGFLDKKVMNFYYLSKNLIETINILEDSASVVPIYTNCLNHAINLIDFSYPGSEEFYNSIHMANAYLEEEVAKVPKNTTITVDVLGHTHIDVAWLWRLKHTREKASRSFSTVLRLMKEYPEYIFLQTQPQIYEYIKQDYPELYQQIKDRVNEGRWEIDGAMWLEADCNIPSGESLVRQIMLGKQFIQQEFGKRSSYLWLPDVFGYSWALPQILKKSGIETFMTTKISWNEYNQLPHDTFIWRGIDGSEILTHFITTPEPEREGNPSFNIRHTYNGHLQPLTVKGIYDSYHDKELNQELLLAYGYGDGGGGANRVMLENRRQMEKIAGLPNVQTSRGDTYFDKLHKKIENADSYVHTWDGELYLEFHRGTYTSQAKNKKNNRKLELALRNAEIISTERMIHNSSDYPAKILRETWKILARNQFHDIIPGSSIKEVYEDSEKDYEQAFDHVHKVIYPNDKSNSGFTLVNSANFKRSEWILLPETFTGLRVVDESGNFLPTTDSSEGTQVYIDELPAFSKKVFFVETKNSPMPTSGHCLGDKIETDYYTIRWNAAGQLTSIFDKTAEREVLIEGELGNQLLLFEDKPIDFDAWNIDIFYNEKVKKLQTSHIEVVTSTSELTEVAFTYEFGKSKINQVMRVYNNSRRIDFLTKVDWQERQQLLKTAFPVDIRSTEATYDIQYGNVKRPTHWNTSWDMAKFETVGHQWADLSESNYGVSLLNNCKYGYDIKDHVMRLTLLKGAVYPNPEADLGIHEFTYSLLPHQYTVLEGDTVQEAWKLNDPLLLIRKADASNKILFNLSDEKHILVDAIKQSENGTGIILRFHDYSGGKRCLSIEPLFLYTDVAETNLMEEIVNPQVDLSKIMINPYEVKTLLFTLKGGKRYG